MCAQQTLRSSLFRVFAVRMKKHWALNYLLSAQWKLWSDWADAQADLSLCWVHVILLVFSCSGSNELGHSKTYKLTCIHKRLRSAWALRSVIAVHLKKHSALCYQQSTQRQDSDPTAQLQRLMWVFPGQMQRLIRVLNGQNVSFCRLCSVSDLAKELSWDTFKHVREKGLKYYHVAYLFVIHHETR